MNGAPPRLWRRFVVTIVSMYGYRTTTHLMRGMGLLDSVVGVALMLLVFTGISGVFKISIEMVTNNKARTGALALAQEQMEYLASLEYAALGTVGGIPQGVVPGIEQMTLNGVSYTRRTLVAYADDPKDGLDTNDENDVIADYKQIKVEVSWFNNVLRSTTLVTRRSPPGIEQLVPGGILSVSVVNAAAEPVVGARVQVVNISTGVNTERYTDATGSARFIGTPPGVGYEISVSKTGYSSAATYSATPENTSPDPGHLTVADTQTTALTLAIDALASYRLYVYEAIQERVWEDTFVDSQYVYASASTTVSAGALSLSESMGVYEAEGYARAVPVSVAYLSRWKEIEVDDDVPPSTAIRYRVYQDDLGTLVSESDLPGNAYGFSVSPIDLSGLATTTYPTVRVGATLTTLDGGVSPRVLGWRVRYDQGPVPFDTPVVTLTGAKTIGTNAGVPVYKYTETHTGTPGGAVDLLPMEWDTYQTTVDGSVLGFDIAESCAPQSVYVLPGATLETMLYLLPHTPHSLRVDVRDTVGVVVPNATVVLRRVGVNETKETSSCGQVFFEDLSPGTLLDGTAYTLEVSAPGFLPQTISDVTVSGASTYSVTVSL